MEKDPKNSIFYETKLGRMYCLDSLEFMRTNLDESSVDLIMTSPPFGLVRKKTYGNVDADNYVTWFNPFGLEFYRILKPHGSLVIDIGGAWNRGQPTRSLYHFELLIMLCKDLGFKLAQEIFWWNPSKLPTPAEWVNVRRVRVKDAVNSVWWLSKTPWPKASNRRVLAPYSDSMKSLLKNGYKAKMRPSGHDISTKFNINNKASIPPNLLAIPNTESNSHYLRYCKQKRLPQHPARFPSEVPEFFIRMLTDPGDLVFDPFAGSCVTGEVAERLKRKWICCDNVADYLEGARGRFKKEQSEIFPDLPENKNAKETFYKIYHPSAMWNRLQDDPLSEDGGQKRQIGSKVTYPKSDTDAEVNSLSVFEGPNHYRMTSIPEISPKTNESKKLRKRSPMKRI